MSPDTLLDTKTRIGSRSPGLGDGVEGGGFRLAVAGLPRSQSVGKNYSALSAAVMEPERRFNALAWQVLLVLKKEGAPRRLMEIAAAVVPGRPNGMPLCLMAMQMPLAAGVIVKVSRGVYGLRDGYEHRHLSWLREREKEGGVVA